MTVERFTIVNDYLIGYDGDYFNLHKPSDIRSLLTVVNALHEENEHYKSRVEYLERKIQRERRASTKQHLKWSKEAEEQINKLEKENAFLTVEVEALRQIKPIRKLPRGLTVLKLDDGDDE